jgi:FKBP-type peptidyl-prolyl cis-trans isomerase
VRVKYTCMLAESNKMVFSTKNVLDRPWIEFVLGIDQIIKGFDRAVPLMCIGERSRMTFTPEYACKFQSIFSYSNLHA